MMLLLEVVLEEQGRSQRWLASQLGIHESSLSKYIRGTRAMPMGLINDAARILNVPVDRLLSHACDVPHGTETVPYGGTRVAA
jgi:hypothetical protein